MILVGTSGFRFADWVGPFYPPYIKKSDHFAWYIRHFPALEVNATYYRIPSPRTFDRWSHVAPPGYPFVVKLHGDVTHKQRDPEDSIYELLRATDPLRSSGKLAGFLAQFPFRFRESPAARAYLARLRGQIPADLPLFVEFRHGGWNAPDLFAFLEEKKIGFCAVDEPDLRDLMPSVSRATNGTGYVRLHGRNAGAWWGGEEAKGERYDYLYSDEELGEWVRKVQELDEQTGRAFVFFNNCYAGQAVRGAKRMQALLGLPVTGEEHPGFAF